MEQRATLCARRCPLQRSSSATMSSRPMAQAANAPPPFRVKAASSMTGLISPANDAPPKVHVRENLQSSLCTASQNASPPSMPRSRQAMRDCGKWQACAAALHSGPSILPDRSAQAHETPSRNRTAPPKLRGFPAGCSASDVPMSEAWVITARGSRPSSRKPLIESEPSRFESASPCAPVRRL